MQQPKSFMQLMSTLHDKKTCREYLEKHRRQGVPICPYCKNQSEHHYKLTYKGEFKGLYKCKNRKKRFTVMTGTIFEGSNVPLEKWFYAIYVFLSHKNGISSVQLAKDIGVTQKTAWFMLTRIRHTPNDTKVIAANRFNGVVQIDEAYVGGKIKDVSKIIKDEVLNRKCR
jgi:transposase-like protein